MTYDPYHPRTIKDADDDGRPSRSKRADPSDSLVKEAADRLLNIIERVERLNEEKADIGEDIKTIFAEGKGMGFDTKIIRKIIAIRKKDAAEWREEQAVLETYMIALGMTNSEEDA